MKIESMNLIVDELNSVDIDIIKKMISAYDNLSEESIKEILVACKDCEYNYNALMIATNKAVLERRTIEEQIRLMKELKECEYEDNALEIATNKAVLERRTIEEQIRLMKELKDCEYDYKALEIATNRNILETKSVEEQIQLIKALKDCEYDYKALEIATNRNILETKSVEEQIQLMRIQRVQNDEVEQSKTHSKKLDEINNLEKLKEYINSLQREYGIETDIKLNDNVKTYK